MQIILYISFILVILITYIVSQSVLAALFVFGAILVLMHFDENELTVQGSEQDLSIIASNSSNGVK